MVTYKLVLESGPKRMRTWAQVPALAGCVFSGPTTDETVARAADSIRDYLRMLARHGEDVDAEREITIEVVRHITDNKWVGFGIELEEDLEPLTRKELDQQLTWADWMRGEMLELLRGVDDDAFVAKPSKGRPIRRIVEHIFAAEYGYVRRFGKIDGVSGPGNVEAMERGELMRWMAHVREKEIARLRCLSDAEMAEVERAGSKAKTARAYVRKVLAHQWEHLVELRERLGVTG